MTNTIKKTDIGYNVEYDFHSLMERQFEVATSMGRALSIVTKDILIKNVRGFDYTKYGAYKSSVTSEGRILVEVFTLQEPA